MLPGTGDASPPRRSPGGVPAGAGATTAGVLDELSGAFASARAALSNFLDLISLEARRAGLALVWMIAFGLVAAVCIFTAWLGLMAALAMWAVALGFPPIAVAIVFALINLVAAAVLIHVCIGISGDLLFSATRRQVAGHSPVQPPAP